MASAFHRSWRMEETLTLVLLCVGSAAVVLAGALWRHRVWRRIGKEFGLSYEAPSLFGPRKLEGHVGDVPVRVAAQVRNPLESRRERKQPKRMIGRVTTLEAGEGAIPRSLSAIRVRGLDRMVQTLRPGGVPSGDKGFDRRIRVEGGDVEVAAVMGEAGRGVVSGHLAKKARRGLDAGIVWTDMRGWAVRYKRFQRHLAVAIEAAGELVANEETIPYRLLHNAQHDPVEAVRSRNIKLLLSRFSDSEPARVLAATCHHSKDREIAMWAAIVVGDGPGIAEMVGDSWTPKDVRATGISALAGIDRPRCTALAKEWLQTSTATPMRQASLEAVANHRLEVSTQVLLAFATDATRADGPSLLTLAESEMHREASGVLAAWSLGHLSGAAVLVAAAMVRAQPDVRSIEPLSRWSGGRGDSKRVARQLRTELQAALSLDGNAPGGLILADRDDVGGLSAVEVSSAEGAVTLATSGQPTAASPTTSAAQTCDTGIEPAHTEIVSEEAINA